MTRGARVLMVVAFAVAGILGFFLVRTFRSPALEAADARGPAASVDDSGRDPVPPQATMPGAPDSGWMATSSGTTAEPVPAAPLPNGPANALGPGDARSYVPSARLAPAPRRTYTDGDLRAIAAARGAGAVRDRSYVVALRQRRVDDLRARIAGTRDAEERMKLMGWLDGALEDLERARRE